MKRRLAVYAMCIVAWCATASVLYAQSDLPITHYEKIAAKEKQAFELYQEGDFSKARASYESALREFQDFKNQFSGWEMSPLVEVKINECKRYLGEIDTRLGAAMGTPSAPAQAAAPVHAVPAPRTSPASVAAPQKASAPMTTQQYIAFLENQVNDLNRELFERKQAFTQGYERSVAEDLEAQRAYLEEQSMKDKDTLAKEITALKDALANATERNNELERRVGDLQNELSQSSGVASGKERRSRIGELQGKIKAISDELRAQKQDAEKAAAQNKKYKKEIESLQADIERLRVAPRAKRTGKDVSATALSGRDVKTTKELEAKIEALSASYEKQLARERDERVAKLNVAGKLAEENANLTQALRDATRDVEAKDKTIAELTAAQKTVQEQLRAARSKRAARGEKNAANEQIALGQETIRGLGQELKKASADVARAQRNIETLTATNARLETQLRDATTLQKDREKYIVQLERENARVAEKAAAAEPPASSQEALNALKEKARKEREVQLAVIDTLTNEKTRLEAQVQSLQKGRIGKEAVVALTKENELLGRQLRDAERTIEGLKSDLEESQSASRAARAKAEKLRSLQEDTKQITQETLQLKETLASYEQELRTLKKEYASQDSVIQKLTADNSRMEVALDDARSGLADKDEDIARMRQERAVAQDTITRMKQERDRLEVSSQKTSERNQAFENISKEKDALTSEIARLKEKIKAQEILQGTLQDDKYALQDELSQAQESLKAQEAQREKTAQETAVVSEKLYQESERVRKNQLSKLLALEEKMNELAAKNEELKGELKTADTRLAASVAREEEAATLAVTRQAPREEVTVTPAAAPAAPVKRTSEYRVNSGDVLEITVYNEPDLTKSMQVTSEGYISYPLLGEIKVVGLTVFEISEKMTELLGKDFLVNPQVAVSVKQFNTISILGQVTKPGTYELKGNMTVVEALAMAGGLNDFSDATDVKVIRNQEGTKINLDVNIEDITKRGDKSKDIILEPNDVIVVAEISKISILGQVVKPGSYELKSNMTIVQAIATAGGFSKYANPNGTKIIRSKDGKETTLRVRVKDITERGDKSKDILLEPGDVVVVPESFF